MGDSPPVEESPKYEDKRTGVRTYSTLIQQNRCQGKNDTLWYFSYYPAASIFDALP